ncbi:uncharacterized protein LOC110824048 isoform X1 [Carica papaya]|uniref:uncharacterized protein LOC110824048 isoform X1 n=1 Tax=Carica papaya TaxID=3649 RepID=UPI000B8CD5FD|nr:uncharacterized protein LOC110824048 isoform X1 [Carica papaya]
MSLLHLQIHNQPLIYQTTFLPPSSSLSPLNFLSLQPFKSVSISISTRLFPLSAVSKVQPSISTNEDQQQSEEDTMELDYLAPDGVVYQKTLRLVECSMFAAVTGLVYFLSNSLAIENYFGCFFSFPIVISSIRWGIAAGRKTMVATALLLFVLSGPVKALTYLLTHGLVGFTMGSLWRYGVSWNLSLFLCTIVRSLGAMGYVLTSSFLIRENILALITINIHASLSYIFATVGINTVPSMSFIYTIFGTVLLLNSIFFVFLLHLLYSVFLSRLGMKSSLRMPVWLEKAL